MAKAQKETTFLISSAGSGYFYSNRRNKKKIKGDSKLSLKKYDPKSRKHVLFEEKKLSKLSKRANKPAAKPAAGKAEAGAEEAAQ